ncbi:MAG: NAD(P)H-dependent oxidoreductase [Pseudomonadales bacterium]|nr:NAD(P)H-dependent oxidoreductase [Pseudomonadales bacterium]
MEKPTKNNSTKKILILAANPKKDSLIGDLASAYADAATNQFDIQLMKLSDMTFNPDLSNGYDEPQTLEVALQQFQAAILWCDHLVIFSPVWWGALPAKLKGLFDRTLLPGFAFQYDSGKSIPKKLLKGKTATIIITMDTPVWYYRWVQSAPALNQLKSATLEFVGFKGIKSKLFGPVMHASAGTRKQWMNSISQLGRQGK